MCEITSASNLTYENALISEFQARKLTDEKFPLNWKIRAFKEIQFCTKKLTTGCKNLSDLTDFLSDLFKKHISIGEFVTFGAVSGIIVGVEVLMDQEPVDLNCKEGDIFPTENHKFKVKLHYPNDENDVIKILSIENMKKTWNASKQSIRQLIKESAEREFWNGSPWILKVS